MGAANTPSNVNIFVSKGADSVRPGWSGVEHGCKGLESQLGSLQKDLLWTDSKDVWSMRLDPVWAEFHGTPSAGSRLVVLVRSPLVVNLNSIKDIDSLIAQDADQPLIPGLSPSSTPSRSACGYISSQRRTNRARRRASS